MYKMKKLKRFLALIDNFKSGLNMFELKNKFIHSVYNNMPTTKYDMPAKHMVFICLIHVLQLNVIFNKYFDLSLNLKKWRKNMGQLTAFFINGFAVTKRFKNSSNGIEIKLISWPSTD